MTVGIRTVTSTEQECTDKLVPARNFADARGAPRARARVDPVNEFSGRFPENSRAAREFSSGWRKSSSQEFRIPPQRLTQIPARARARDTRATDSVFGSCVILRNSAVAGNRPESPAGIYLNPGGLEGVRVRINRFIPIPIVVGIWHLTVHVDLMATPIFVSGAVLRYGS